MLNKEARASFLVETARHTTGQTAKKEEEMFKKQCQGLSKKMNRLAVKWRKTFNIGRCSYDRRDIITELIPMITPENYETTEFSALLRKYQLLTQLYASLKYMVENNFSVDHWGAPDRTKLKVKDSKLKQSQGAR